MSTRKQILLLAGWCLVLAGGGAAAIGIDHAITQPQPAYASLGTLFEAAANGRNPNAPPQARLATDAGHQTLVGTGSVTWWDAAGGEHRTPISTGDQSLVESTLDQDGYFNFRSDTGVPLQTLLLIIIPTLIVVMVIVILYWRTAGSGLSRLLRLHRPPSAGRPATTFADVAGCDEAKLELGELVQFLRDPGRYASLGARVPKGVLLVGPPGTGKTLLARAVAGEADCAFLALSGSEFVEMFVGVGAARVRDLFRRARKQAPCIVFLDEIDAVGRRRGGTGVHAGHEEREQTLNQLLVEMDGFDQNLRIVVIAATNRADVLDEALLRPGRFDRTVSIDTPDLAGRRAILALHARSTPLAADADLDLLARRTPGLTGADLASLVNEAAVLAAREQAVAVGMTHLERAVDRVLAGPERTGRLVTLEERRIIAHHEMGHALVLASLPGTDPVRRVSLIGRGRSLGWTLTVPEGDRVLGSRSQLAARLCGLLGGRAAEELLLGPADITTGGADDLQKATRLARQMVEELGMSRIGVRVLEGGAELGAGHGHSDELAGRVDAEVDRILAEALDRARSILVERRDLLEALAGRLLEVETMSAEDMAEVMGGAGVVEVRGVPAGRAGAPALPAPLAPGPGTATRAPALVAAMTGVGAAPAAAEHRAGPMTGVAPPGLGPVRRALLRAVRTAAAPPRGGGIPG
jgi:cell division protease FtsH